MMHRADSLRLQGFLLSFIITVMAYEGRYLVIRKLNRQKLRGDRRLGAGGSPCPSFISDACTYETKLKQTY